MSLRHEQPNRYKKVNKESYVLFLDLYIFRKSKSLNWMSCDASRRADNKEREKIFFMIKKEWKLKKTKSKAERVESDVP